MLRLDFANKTTKGRNLLCLGAHCDDIEIGCGGTILKLIKEGRVKSVRWVVFTSNKERELEAKKSAKKFLQEVNEREINIKSFKDGFLPSQLAEVKQYFEEIKNESQPDLIFTHFRNDLHQDHRLISELTWNTFRNHLILEYEIPKYDGDLDKPNCFVHLNETLMEEKIDYLLEYFGTQFNKHWFDRETFLSLMRIRGLESANEQKYSEAFHVRKIVF
ncbi:PIG-L deacetylase family protein [Xanthovirga aplysinae]|uniref:PIG-L deacetylase family protein n=1 Tax=Xanthovirga aplysinae TaxID=2529853 RepID=UPI0012BC1BE3|nr:PIG-L deacetylase family protein [Xanthovirga aplysinae]MTI31183.1 PIG-L family deacetylase [Xanthovirga aplysinae]